MNKEIIDKTIAALRHNHFEAFFAHNTAEASAIFFRDIFPGLQVETVSWGDSETMKATGVLNELQKNPELSVIDSFAPGMSRKQTPGSVNRPVSNGEQRPHTKRSIGQSGYDR